MRGRIGPVAALAALVVALSLPATAYPRPGDTTRLSVAPGGQQSNASALIGDISADGRFVAFSSTASNLVPGDLNEVEDVFVLDRATGAIDRVSVSSDGEEGVNTSYGGDISADGRFVAFISHAWNLVPNDGDFEDVFVHDRVTGETTRVSVSSAGVEGNAASRYPALSADGRIVVFNSGASNLVPGDTNGTCGIPSTGCDIFVHDLATGTTTRESTSAEGEQGNNSVSGEPSVSADGRFVAFSSAASNLVPGDTSNTIDVFVKDVQTGAIEMVSVSSTGTQANAGSTQPAISGDGNVVVFSSPAGNLVPNDGNRVGDVFVHDRATDRTERISVTSQGVEGNRVSAPVPALSADGRRVAFQSDATNLVAGDTNNARDVFVRDRALGTTGRVTLTSAGAQAAAGGNHGVMSADGSLIGFHSGSSDLVPGDTNGASDVFLRNHGPVLGVGRLDANGAGDAVEVAGWAAFSGAVLATATDPETDGDPRAGTLGAQVTGASLAYRVEEEDLLATISLASLPTASEGTGSTPAVVGLPGLVYGFELSVGGVRHEVRALRAGVTSPPPAAPLFALYRCAPTCAEVARLSGGYATTEREVVVSVPLSALGASAGQALTGIRAFTAVGEAATGGVFGLDEADLGSAAIPEASVSLGVAPAGTPASSVAFVTLAALAGGSFTGSVPGLGSGPHDVWARVCLGDACETSRAPVG